MCWTWFGVERWYLAVVDCMVWWMLDLWSASQARVWTVLVSVFIVLWLCRIAAWFGMLKLKFARDSKLCVAEAETQPPMRASALLTLR